MRRFRGLEAAQFICVWKFVKILQAEELQKEGRRLVQKWTARLLGTARDPDDLPLQERGQHAIYCHPPYGFDLSAAHRLAVSYDRQRFQRRLAEPWRLWLLEKPVGPDGEPGAGLQLVATCNALHHET